MGNRLIIIEGIDYRSAVYVSDNFYSSKNPPLKEGAERIGILGEIAVSKLLGIKPDLSIYKWGLIPNLFARPPLLFHLLYHATTTLVLS